MPPELPGGRAVTATHPANPGTIGTTHDEVRAHARDHGLTTTGVVYEVYGHPDAGGGVDTEVFHLHA